MNDKIRATCGHCQSYTQCQTYGVVLKGYAVDQVIGVFLCSKCRINEVKPVTKR